MPQMSPFNWTLMFMMFLLMTIALMSKFFSMKKIPLSFNSMNTKHYNLTTHNTCKWMW